MNSTLIPKHTRSDDVSDELLDDYSEEDVPNKGKDETTNGGTLIIDGVNSFIFLPNDENISDDVQPCRPGYPGCKQPTSPTRTTISQRITTITPRRPPNSARPSATSPKPSPIITPKPPSSEELGSPNCDPKGFLAFLGIMPAGCSPSSDDSFSQLGGTCSDPEKNQPKKVSRMVPISTNSSGPSKSRELPVYSERKNNLWDDYVGLEPKNKDLQETMWNMENVLSPTTNQKVDGNLLRKMYNEYVNNKNTAKHR